jgi:hypothetical protein
MGCRVILRNVSDLEHVLRRLARLLQPEDEDAASIADDSAERAADFGDDPPPDQEKTAPPASSGRRPARRDLSQPGAAG